MSKDIRLSYIINNLCVVMKIKNVLKLTKLVWCLQVVKLSGASRAVPGRINSPLDDSVLASSWPPLPLLKIS